MRRKSERVAFTAAKLAALKPKAERYWVLDTRRPGLAVMVTPAGKKSYYYVRKVAGRVERVKLGDVGMPEDALKKAIGKTQGQIADGRSPTRERRAVRREMTLAELWALFQVRRATKRSLPTDTLRYKHLAGLANRKVSAISHGDVSALLAEITTSAGPIAANRTRALLHSIFAVGIEAGLEIANPVTGTMRNAEHSKSRYLEPAELRRFWQALLAEPEDETRVFLQLLLLTAARGATVAAARWADIDLGSAVWHVPPESMKAGKPLDLPLAKRTVEILRERANAAQEGAEWVFPAPGKESGHLASVPREGWARVVASAEIAGVTPHDLRRTHATYGLAAGIPIEVLGKALGHTPIGGVTAIYAQADLALVRLAVERTVDAILKVAEAPEAEDAGKVLAFPRPVWAQEAAQ
jgi:integrase